MPTSASRRDFLCSLLGTGLGAAVAASGCDERARHAISGQLLGQNVTSGHALREDPAARIGQIAASPAIAAEVVIVGGGAAGLSAAYQLKKQGCRDVVLLELESELGGTSLGGKSPLTAFPWGAHYVPVPSRENPDLVALFREMSVLDESDDAGRLRVREPYLVRAPDERIFYRGYWYPGLFLHAGASPRDRAQLAAFEAEVARYAGMRDGQGKRAFAIPISQSSQDPDLLALDALPATHWLGARGLDSPRLLWLLDYACRDDFGTRLADTSTWALLLYFAARIEVPGEAPAELITWPEGNARIVSHLSEQCGARLRTGELVVDIAQTEEGVHVHAFRAADGFPRHYRARHVIVATPRFIATRIVRPLRASSEHADGFEYAPWIVANLHLSERPTERGAPPAWDNVLYDSPSLGYVTATHQRGSDYGPSVLTYYLPLAHVDSRHEREGLLRGSWPVYRDAILGDLSRAHPNLQDVVHQLDVFRWGHAMIKPRPGFRSNASRAKASLAVGNIHFAHTDLSGVALFEEAFDQGLRAARDVAASLRP